MHFPRVDIGTRTVPADHLNPGVLAKPRLQGVSVTVGQHVHPPACLRIDQHGRVAAAPPQREVVHAQHPRNRRRRQRHPQQRTDRGIARQRPGREGQWARLARMAAVRFTVRRSVGCLVSHASRTRDGRCRSRQTRRSRAGLIRSSTSPQPAAEHPFVGGAQLDRVLKVVPAAAGVPARHVVRHLERAEAVSVQLFDPVRNGGSPVRGATVSAAVTGGDVRHSPRLRPPGTAFPGLAATRDGIGRSCRWAGISQQVSERSPRMQDVVCAAGPRPGGDRRRPGIAGQLRPACRLPRSTYVLPLTPG
jgi:hypothetical protein